MLDPIESSPCSPQYIQLSSVSDSVSSISKVSFVQFLIQKEVFASITHEINAIDIITANNRASYAFFIFILTLDDTG